MGEILLVEGEDAESVHVVDVEPEPVAGDFLLGEFLVQPVEVREGPVAPAALVVAEGPERRERRRPDEPLHPHGDVPDRGAEDEIEFRRPARGADGKPFGQARRAVKSAGDGVLGLEKHEDRVRVVHEDPDPALSRFQEEVGDRCVHGIGEAFPIGLVVEIGPDVGVPEFRPLARPLEGRILLSQAIEAEGLGGLEIDDPLGPEGAERLVFQGRQDLFPVVADAETGSPGFRSNPVVRID